MKFWYDKNEEKIDEFKHLMMLDLRKEELEEIGKGDEFVEAFREEVVGLNERETFQSLMTYEEDQRKIRNTELKLSHEEGLEKGLEEGRKESKEKIAKNLKGLGMNFEQIALSCDLSLEEVKKLL